MNLITENQTEYQAFFTFWHKEEAEIVVRFDAEHHFTEEEKQEVFQQVATKTQWLEQHKEAVLEFLLKNEEVRELFEEAQEEREEEGEQAVSDEQFCEAVYLHNLYCKVGKEIACTFDIDTAPDYFLGHLVNIKLDDSYHLSLETISG